jgi:uncharacterized membrane protein
LPADRTPAGNSALERRLHAAFEVGILLKGLNAAMECIAALVLLFASHETIVRVVGWLVHGELNGGGGGDVVARFLLGAAQRFSVGEQHFAALYLASHGVVKLALVVGLVRDARWAYPASLAVLGLFIFYQLYRMTFAPSLLLAGLTIFDLVVVWLIWHEWEMKARAGAGR